MRRPLTIKAKLTLTIIAMFFVFVFLTSFTTYNLYYNNLISYTNRQIEATSYQSLNNYEAYFDNVIKVTTNIQERINNSEITDEKEQSIEYLDDLKSLREEVMSIAIYDLQGQLIISSSNYNNNYDITLSDWFVNAKNNPLINVFSRIDVVNNETYAFTLSKQVTYGKDSKKGIAKIDLDFTDIVTLIDRTDLGEGGHITIYDKGYNVVFCSREYNEQEKELVKKLVLGNEIITLNGVEYNLFLSTISKTTWKVAIFTNYENVSSVIWNFLYAIILLAITISFLFLIFINLLATSITTPISKLKNQMANIVSLDYIQIPKEEIRGSIEVEALADSFDKLLERIRSQTIKLKREEAEKHKSELRALQNQINPHFLYNTLDSIIYLIDKGDNEKAEEMILALSKFFRISISRGKNIIPLSKEVEHVKNYLLIQKIRFGEKFNYSIDFDPQLNKYYTIKLILQPLVENAIVHGLKEIQGVGEIFVKAYLDGDFIKIIIKDNGFGILPEKLEEIRKSLNDNKTQNGVGIKNVYQRLKLYYGDQADIIIESELDIGTTITILIPSQEALSDEEK